MADLLSTSISGLLAFQRALDTTRHNISNANTVGYSRQLTEFMTRNAQQSGAGWAPGGPIAQHPPMGAGQQVIGHGQVVEVGRGEVAVGDHSWPAHPQVGSEPVEGLLGALVAAEGGQLGQPPAAIGTAEAADRHPGSCPGSRPAGRSRPG